MSEPFKLHIGGWEAKSGWTNLNILPGPVVDIVGSCTDLSMLKDESVDEIYASHVLEHLTLQDAGIALKEICRVLKPRCLLKGGVPDLAALARLYLELDEKVTNYREPAPGEEAEDVFTAMTDVINMIYGGHHDEFDVHHYGYNMNILAIMLKNSGFSAVKRVDSLDEFTDTSTMVYRGVPISLNFIAMK